MSPAHVLEPTYRRLKAALLEGRFPVGAKLEAMRLADDFGVSMTPVRDSLNQLVGERLVDLTPGEGFRVPLLTEQALRDMLGVNLLLLERALDVGPRELMTEDAKVHGAPYAEGIARVFSHFARSSKNQFLLQSVNEISDRLHTVRKLEPDVLPNASEFLEALSSSANHSSNKLALVRQYHAESVAHVSDLVALLGAY